MLQDDVDICQAMDMTRKWRLQYDEACSPNRGWWTGALGQISFNLLYGDKLMNTPLLGPYFVLSATQTAVSVAVSYAFQVVSHLVKVPRDRPLMSTGWAIYRQSRSECQGTEGRVIARKQHSSFTI